MFRSTVCLKLYENRNVTDYSIFRYIPSKNKNDLEMHSNRISVFMSENAFLMSPFADTMIVDMKSNLCANRMRMIKLSYN